MSANVNIGDRVEVSSKKLKTNGQKGTIKRLDFLLHVLATKESGHPDFHDRFKTVVFRNGTEVYVKSDLVDECNTVLVSLDNGRHITTSLFNLKVISKATYPTVDINYCYVLTNHYTGRGIKGQVVNCEFNENRDDGCYIFHLDAGVYEVINTAEYDIKKMSNEEFVVFEQLLKEHEERKKHAEKMNKMFTIVIEGTTLDDIVNDNPKTTRSMFDPHYTMAVMRRKTIDTHLPRGNISFTVRGFDVKQTITDIMKKMDVQPEQIKVYELGNQQSVKVNVTVDIE